MSSCTHTNICSHCCIAVSHSVENCWSSLITFTQWWHIEKVMIFIPVEEIVIRTMGIKSFTRYKSHMALERTVGSVFGRCSLCLCCGSVPGTVVRICSIWAEEGMAITHLLLSYWLCLWIKLICHLKNSLWKYGVKLKTWFSGKYLPRKCALAHNSCQHLNHHCDSVRREGLGGGYEVELS